MENNSKIYVAGHRGMVGSAIVRELRRQGYTNLLTRTHAELDLTRQADVERFFADERPDYVFLAAAKVGGIVANQSAPADFMYQNMALEMNVIHAAWQSGCRKLEFLGSSCIYPRLAPQPMKESCLLTSALEQTNEAYALAKISGLKYCEYLNRQYGTDFISVMPTNLYGPNDNYHPEHSHVLPALIRRFHEAKVQGQPAVTCWGDGSPLREFLYVDDLANLITALYLVAAYIDNDSEKATELETLIDAINTRILHFQSTLSRRGVGTTEKGSEEETDPEEPETITPEITAIYPKEGGDPENPLHIALGAVTVVERMGLILLNKTGDGFVTSHVGLDPLDDEIIAESITQNSDTRIEFTMTPDLAEGKYTVRIEIYYNGEGNPPLAEPKVIEFGEKIYLD